MNFIRHLSSFVLIAVLLLFLILFLVACQSSLITDLIARPGEMLYHDDFSDPTSGWARASASSGSLGYDGGTYRITVADPDYDLWAVSGQFYRDVRIEADATRLAGPYGNRFGLICRYQDPRNFYFFVVSSDGYYAIGKVNHAVRSLLGQEMMAYNVAVVPGKDPDHLRFDCVGQTLTGYINGQVVAATRDADFHNGDAGLIAGTFDQPGVDVSFDNFIIYKP